MIFPVLLLALAFTVLTIGSLRASYGLHSPLIHALLRAPIAFFDTTPIGRVINRLSRDLDVIDKLQDNIRMCTQTLLNACMILVLISISTPIFLVCAAPLIFIYYFVMIYYIPTSRQLKRLESANRSPILSTIAESIHGASSIRAFDKANCCIWFSLLSKRLHSIHPSFCVIFAVLVLLKAVQVLVLTSHDYTHLKALGELNPTVLISKQYSYRTPNHGSFPENPSQETSIVWPFIRIQKATIITLTLARLTADIVHYLNPILLKQLIDYVSLHDQPLSFGIAIACIMFLSSTTRSLLQNYQIAGMCRQAVYYQTVLSNAILHKILRLSPSARSHRTAGEILNHAAVDIEIIVHSVPYLQNMWSVPFQVTLAMTMLAITLGWAAMAGVIIMIMFIPLNLFTSRFIKLSQQKQMKIKDERTKLSNEMLNGIKVVKLYAWEESFEEQINKLRAKEVKMLRNVCILSRIVDVANAASPFLVAIGSFTCYVLWSPDENGLTPSVAFVALVIFNQLRQPMRMVANLINTLVQARVSNKRLRQFLNDEELEKKTEVALGNAIVFKGASLNWRGPMNPPVLRDLSATVKPGQLIAIVGSVGGGKSSLLSAVLDEMVLLEGRVKVGGSIAYVPQHSWIFNKSIKENILFGNEYSKYFYEQVVGSCQLRPDFKHFQQGEETMVGENGITLSGGQKARISLARAVYQDKDIYLLDDPLSAVDAHVGRALFDKVIGPEGLLRSKTRVLVTHNLQYTKYVDSIYVIEDGQIVQHGKFEEIAHLDGPFGRLWMECEKEEEEEEEEISETPPEVVNRKRTSSHFSEASEKIEKKAEKKPENVENVQLGRVKKSVYKLYIKTMGVFNSTAFLVFFIAHFTVMIMRSLWLSDWSNENAELKKRGGVGNETMISVETRLIVYAGFGGLESGDLHVDTLSKKEH
uniref:ABC transmembrane type-1 domain-containing protein n=1 Tax=Caenorhabditis tropicalis TaxID=1561998 RepID=A0A1I7U8T3_9PELO